MDSLEALLQACTVQILFPGLDGWGTGFFVAPDLVLTCAHVVKDLGDGEARLRWQQQPDFARAKLVQFLPEADVALLRITIARETEVPCVYLDEAIEPGHELYFFGYPDQDFPDGCPVMGSCEGLTGDLLPLIKFRQAQVRPGMSGSPLLNRHTGKVCGMVKFTRDRSLDLGGGAVMARTILEGLPELRSLQRQFHKEDERWETLLRARSQARPAALQGVPHNLPWSGVSEFVGRDAALAELCQQLQGHGRVAITAIAGMGGVGKSELALQYAIAHKDEYPAGVCWLDAQEAEIATKILQLALSWFGLEPPEGLDLAEQVKFCWQRWAAGKLLVIVDGLNTTEDYERIAPYLPPAEPRFRILLTTRERIGPPVVRLDLGVLGPRSALALLASLVGRERLRKEPWQARQLCQRLGYLPLGLELVGRYLALEEDLTLAELLDLLAAEGLTQDSLVERDPQMTAKRGVKAAFELSWKALGPEARRLGYLLSLFAPTLVPWELAEECVPPEQRRVLKSARRQLLRLSLLERQTEGSYRLHPLIRDFFGLKREFQAGQDASEINALIQQFCQKMVSVAQMIPETPTRQEILAVTDAMPHVAEAATTWKNFLADNDLLWPSTGLGRFYAGQGAYAQAEPWQVQCWTDCCDRLGPEHLAVATSLHNLALLCSSQGRYEKAEALYKESLELTKRLLGENHLDVATSLHNLASLYHAQGRYEEAEKLYEKSLELTKCLLGEEHPAVVTNLHNLASLYYLQGHYEKAESLFTESLTLRRRLLGEEHPDVATSLNNLASLHNAQGKYEEAELLFIESLTLRRRLLGEEHPNVAASLNNLASLYYFQGKYEEAELLFTESLELTRRLLGENHPDVANSLHNLASLCNVQGKYEEAELLFTESLALRKCLLGENHPDVANSLHNLASLCNAQGKYEEAESLYKESLELAKRLLGEEHPDVATSLGNLANLYNEQGKYEEAELLLTESLALRKRLLGEEHPDVATSLHNLASLYDSRGRYEKAESLYKESLALRKRLLGEEHPVVATSLNDLAVLYHSQERYAEAELLYSESLALRKCLLSKNHPDVAVSLNNLAHLYQVQGRYEEAELLYKELLALWRSRPSNDHPHMAINLSNMGGLYASQGRYEEAVPLYEEALGIAQRRLGSQHPRTVMIAENLSVLRQRMQDQGRDEQS